MGHSRVIGVNDYPPDLYAAWRLLLECGLDFLGNSPDGPECPIGLNRRTDSTGRVNPLPSKELGRGQCQNGPK